MSNILIKTEKLQKFFKVVDKEVPVLKGIDIEINSGDFVIIFGPSGCGKSTMLHTLLGLEPPSGGRVVVDGKNFYDGTEDDRAIFRRHRVGIIYQQPLWVTALNVIENISVSLHLLDYNEEMVRQKAMGVLKLVGMEAWANYHPSELSSGQQQKISLARSMVIDPILIVADEPTGNLDTVSGQELIETFLTLHQKGITIIMVTHDLEYLKYGSKIIHMVDGEVVEIYEPKKTGRSKLDVKGKRGGDAFEQVNVRDRDFLKKMNI